MTSGISGGSTGMASSATRVGRLPRTLSWAIYLDLDSSVSPSGLKTQRYTNELNPRTTRLLRGTRHLRHFARGRIAADARDNPPILHENVAKVLYLCGDVLQ